MDPVLGAALISGGSKLLGGILGGGNGGKMQSYVQNKRAKMGAIAGAAKQSRESGEDWGFNPLTLLGVTGGTPIAGGSAPLASNALISGVADFATALLPETEQQEQENRQNELKTRLMELEVERLEAGDAGAIAARAGSLGNRPRSPQATPGYKTNMEDPAKPAHIPTDRAGLGLQVTSAASFIDSRRAVEETPVKSTSGWMQVDNPYFSFYVPTLDGDEPLDLLDAPSMGVMGAQALWQGAPSMTMGGGRTSRPRLSHAEAWAEKRKKNPPVQMHPFNKGRSF